MISNAGLERFWESSNPVNTKTCVSISGVLLCAILVSLLRGPTRNLDVGISTNEVLDCRHTLASTEGDIPLKMSVPVSSHFWLEDKVGDFVSFVKMKSPEVVYVVHGVSVEGKHELRRHRS